MTLIDEIQAMPMACYEAGIYDPLIDYCMEHGIMVVVTERGHVYAPVTIENRWFSAHGRRWHLMYLRSPDGWLCPRQTWVDAGSPYPVWHNAVDAALYPRMGGRR